jgi:Tol biopolymer transport system component
MKVLDAKLPVAGFGQFGRDLLWSGDDRSLVYVGAGNAGANLWAQPIDGGKPIQITHFPSGRIFAVAISHDGKRFAIARGSETSDVVLIRNFK